MMENTKAASFKTDLSARTLWYDGDSTVNVDTLMNAILNGVSTDGLYVEELTTDIKQYNKSVLKSERIGIKENIRPLTYEWNIPEKYKTLDVYDYVGKKLLETGEVDTPDLMDKASRVADEMELYQKLGLIDVLRTLIYVINTLIENNIVWGVGRGSSVSSYVLYLIGVHDVDSFKYGLNIEEFLRTED